VAVAPRRQMQLSRRDALRQEVAAAEARRSQLELQAEAAVEERRVLEAALEELQLSCAAGQADVAAAQRDLAHVRDKARPLVLVLSGV
jgi:chromosome segregation ATPase